MISKVLVALGLAFSAVASFGFDGSVRDWVQASSSPELVSFDVRATQRLGHSTSLAPATITVGGGTVNIEFTPGHLELRQTLVIGWVSAAARAVTAYYGRFPVQESNVFIVPVQHRRGVLSGTSWGTRPVSTRVYLGELADNSQLKTDWIMTHEMVHYAFPSMPEEHHWIEEGIATYVESLARLETGEIGVAKVWGGFDPGTSLWAPGSWRRWPRSYPQLGPHVLGRRHVLSAR